MFSDRTCIFFDMDGTLNDSVQGITNARDYAFAAVGLPVPPMTQEDYLGPGVTQWLPKFLGAAHADKFPAAYKAYRHYYDDLGGKFENKLYDGIVETLTLLKNAGKRLFIATSKPEPPTQEIVDHFNLRPYFERVCGSELSGKRNRKAEVIQYLLNETHVDPRDAVMVGDRRMDVEGAAVFFIPTIGALWGYGTAQELTEAGAAKLAITPLDLTALLLECLQPPQNRSACPPKDVETL